MQHRGRRDCLVQVHCYKENASCLLDGGIYIHTHIHKNEIYRMIKNVLTRMNRYHQVCAVPLSLAHELLIRKEESCEVYREK